MRLRLLPLLALGLSCDGPPDLGAEEPAVGPRPLVVVRAGRELATTAVEDPRVSRDHLLADGALVSPAQLRQVEVDVPRGEPWLRFAYVVTDPGSEHRRCLHGHPFTVDVQPVVPSGPSVRVFGEPVQRVDWHEYWNWGSSDLSRWEGQRVSLRFGVGQPGDTMSGCSSFQGAFGDVHVVAGDLAPQRPDLLLVVVDTMRGDHVGMLEGSPVRTANLVAWSDQAAWFDDALAPSSWTKESVYALLTGTYLTMGELRPEGRGVRFPDDVPTITERLQAAGYRTLALVNNPILEPPDRLERGFDLFRASSDAEVAADLGELIAASDPRQPRFVYVHLMGPHLDYCYRDGISAPHFEALGQPENPRDCLKVPRDSELWTDDLKARAAAYYRGEVEYADHVTAQALDLLTDSAIGREPWLFFTADHGEEFWDHGGYEHGHTLFQEVIRVPLLVRPPAGGDWSTGRRHEPVSLIDVAHTVLDVAGLEPLSTPVGVSLLPVLRGQAIPSERVRLSAGTIYGPARAATVIEGYKTAWNLGYATETPVAEVFDLGADPGELTALDSSGHPDLARSAWATFQHLATTGSSALRVDLAPRPPDGGPIRLAFDFPGQALLVRVEPAAELVELQARDGGFELVAAPVLATTAWIQLDGLTESMGPLVAHATLSAGSGEVIWPQGSTESDQGVAIPTPWALYRPVTGGEALGEEQAARVSWSFPGSWTPGGRARHPDTTEELRALGYVE